jgi:DNA-binding response OmpR family regulator
VWRCESGARAPEPHSHGTAYGGRAAGTARRVLVVDDERAIRLLCRVNLAASGMDVLEAENGLTALELARCERPDLVLLDVMMPDVDGWTVARELADDERTREIPIVFLTARADTADKRRGQQLGGVGYVVKPFDPVTIGDLVEDVIERVERGEREQLTRDISLTPGP